MNITLLANVGNSDLQIVDPSLVPKRQDGSSLSTRELGETLREHLQEYITQLTMPLLTPTLRWLWHQHPFEGNELHIVLFASNQPTFAPEKERSKDTKPHAEVIHKLLTNGSYLKMQLSLPKIINIPKRNIIITDISGNPADYANMLAFYMQDLPRRKRYIADDSAIYLEVSGGTPAMTAMLIVAAVETFGLRARTLYVERGATESYEVEVAHQLFAQRARHTLLTQINLYSYATALQTMSEQGSLISHNQQARDCSIALLQYADRRLAFDFDAARQALQQARRLSIGETQSLIQHWLNTLNSSDPSALLAELLHSMAIRDSFNDYAFFVQLLFRFQEATLHVMAHHLGMVYKKPSDDEYLDSVWLDTQPGLVAFAREYRLPGTKQTYDLDLRKSLNRISLSAIVDYLLQQGIRPDWQPVSTCLHQLSTLAELRNKGLSGHGFQGISRQKVEAAYGASLPHLLQQLHEIYFLIFGQVAGDSPYDQVNQLLQQIIADA